MALTDDQRAMLQLLLEGGQSYADLGALLGVDPQEVKRRARAALTELGGIDPDSRVGLTDYLLGQADPIGRADAARQLQSDPGTADLATKIATQLRLIAPKARLPELPGQVGTAPLAEPAPGVPTVATPEGGPSAAAARAGGVLRSFLDRIGRGITALGARERRLPVALGLAALLVLVVVLVATGVFSGDGDDKTSDQASSAGEDLKVVELQPQSGSQASGQVVFAAVQDQAVVQVNLAGLEPSGNDQNYIVWLYNSKKFAFPLARQQVGKDGNLTGQAAVPAQVVSLIGPDGFSQVDVSLASNEETQAALQAAADAKQLPPHSGRSVLRGEIPSGTATVLGAGSAGAGAPTPTGTTPPPTSPTTPTSP